MATNQQRFLYNLVTGGNSPLLIPGLFNAGSTNAIKQGELLELTSNYVPMDSAYDMTAASDPAAVAHVEIKAGDLAGYYPIICPRPGDCFRYDLLSTDAQTPAIGTAIYWSDSETVTTTSATYILGNIAGWQHYPLMQGYASDDASADRGTTIRSVDGGEVIITFQPSNTPWGALQTA